MLSLYRQFVRALKDVPDKQQRKELRDFFRADFERSRGETDTVSTDSSSFYALFRDNLAINEKSKDRNFRPSICDLQATRKVFVGFWLNASQ